MVLYGVGVGVFQGKLAISNLGEYTVLICGDPPKQV